MRRQVSIKMAKNIMNIYALYLVTAPISVFFLKISREAKHLA